RMRQFVADASHELRTPLTAIRGYAEYYRQRGGLDNGSHPAGELENEPSGERAHNGDSTTAGPANPGALPVPADPPVPARPPPPAAPAGPSRPPGRRRPRPGREVGQPRPP